MRAIGEGIAEASVGRIADFATALRADRRVRNDAGRDGSAGAFDDFESGEGFFLCRLKHHRVDARKRRPVGLQARNEQIPRRLVGGDLDFHARWRVADRARQPEFIRQPPDKGTKADALHQSVHMDAPAGKGRHGAAVTDRLADAFRCMAIDDGVRDFGTLRTKL